MDYDPDRQGTKGIDPALMTEISGDEADRRLAQMAGSAEALANAGTRQAMMAIVPPGFSSGMMIRVIANDRELDIVIPPGLTEGMPFEVDVVQAAAQKQAELAPTSDVQREPPTVKLTPRLQRIQSTRRFRDRFEEHTPMMVMRFDKFRAHGSCPRSDVAQANGMLIPFGEKQVCIFVSHNWWQTAKLGARGDGGFDTGAPDYTSGENAHLKFRTLVLGVENLIAKDALDASSVCLWMDWFSIEQDDPKLKAAGVQVRLLSPSRRPRWHPPPSSSHRAAEASVCPHLVPRRQSLIRYTCNCKYMLIPAGAPLVDVGARFPEQLPVYGGRAWCRLEFFCFSYAHRPYTPGLFSPFATVSLYLLNEERSSSREYRCMSEMQKHPGGVPLYAVGSKGKLKQFGEVNIEGGASSDMPSQGALTLEGDRGMIQSLEDEMIAEFGHQVLRNAAEESPTILKLTGKMLRDEHMHTLVAHIGSPSCVCIELHLRNNQIGDAGVAELCGGAQAPNIEYISLSSNRIGDAGAKALTAALEGGAWPRMRQIYVGGNPIGADARAALKTAAQARDVTLPYL